MGLSIFYTANGAHMSYSTHTWWDPRAGSNLFQRNLLHGNLSPEAPTSGSLTKELEFAAGGTSFMEDQAA
jgi:hypothetical protein